jgi:DNA-binding NtrC family response regulator
MKDSISILIVDDEEIMRNVVMKILSREGYDVQTAPDGAAALDYIGANKVDIVVSDMKMPGIDGLELLQIIKKGWSNIGVILMTGHGDTYTVKDALLGGADEYITKPFKSHEVSMVVERAYYRILARERDAAMHPC